MTSFALSLAAAILGAFTLGFFLSGPGENAGKRLAGPPLAAILLIVAILHLERFAARGSTPGPEALETLARGLWGSLGALWVFLADRLRESKEETEKLQPRTIAVMAVNIGTAFLSVLPAAREEGILVGVHQTVSTASLYYAGISFLGRIVRGKNLSAAFRVCSRMVFLTMLSRPVVLFTEISGFKYPGFDAERPLWEQAYPLYGLAVFAVSLASLRQGRGASAGAGPIQDRLTDRERRVIDLLKRGYSYKAVASELKIGMSTVKTHATAAYRKLGIRKRGELFQREPSMPDS